MQLVLTSLKKQHKHQALLELIDGSAFAGAPVFLFIADK
jgi:hypothetical protein